MCVRWHSMWEERPNWLFNSLYSWTVDTIWEWQIFTIEIGFLDYSNMRRIVQQKNRNRFSSLQMHIHTHHMWNKPNTQFTQILNVFSSILNWDFTFYSPSFNIYKYVSICELSIKFHCYQHWTFFLISILVKLKRIVSCCVRYLCGFYSFILKFQTIEKKVFFDVSLC